MQVSNEDKAFLKGLIKLLDDATFSLKQREVATFVHVVKWVKDLEKRFEEKPKKPAVKKTRKKTNVGD